MSWLACTVAAPRWQTCPSPAWQRSTEDHHRNVGLAWVDVNSLGRLMLQVIQNDTQTFAQTMLALDALEPAGVLLCRSHMDKPLACRVITEVASDDTVVSSVHRKYFDEAAGRTKLEGLSLKALVLPDLPQARLAIGAAHALLHFVAAEQNLHWAPQSLSIDFQSSSGRLGLSSAAAKHLRLLPHKHAQTGTSLFSSVKRTVTSVGRRLLRNSLTSPINDVPTLVSRLDAVEELGQQPTRLSRVRAALKRLPDLDYIINHLVVQPKTATPRTLKVLVHVLLQLKAALSHLRAVADILEGSAAALLGAVRSCLESPQLQEMQEIILQAVDEEAQPVKATWLRQQEEVFSVRMGQDPHLDMTRVLFADALDKVDALVEGYKHSWGMPTLVLRYSKGRGYHLVAPLSVPVLPGEAVQAVRQAKGFHFTTDALRELNAQVSTLLYEMYSATNAALLGTKASLLPFLPVLFAAAESTALLDLVQGFATLATQAGADRPWCRPVFSEIPGYISLSGARHASGDELGLPLVPNTISLHKAQSLALVTGANGAGKSTLLHTVATVTILAHCGAFVPCEAAELAPLDHLLVRMGFDDDTATNASTFAVEMRELAHIEATATNKSLVLIDELGRGTDPLEGVAIAWAACEALLARASPVLFVTHFHELTALAGLYEGATHIVMNAEADGQRGLRFHFSAVAASDAAAVNDYGLRAAAMVGFPPELLGLAETMKAQLQTDRSWVNRIPPASSAGASKSPALADKVAGTADAGLHADTADRKLITHLVESSAYVSLDQLEKQILEWDARNLGTIPQEVPAKPAPTPPPNPRKRQRAAATLPTSPSHIERPVPDKRKAGEASAATGMSLAEVLRGPTRHPDSPKRPPSRPSTGTVQAANSLLQMGIQVNTAAGTGPRALQGCEPARHQHALGPAAASRPPSAQTACTAASAAASCGSLLASLGGTA